MVSQTMLGSMEPVGYAVTSVSALRELLGDVGRLSKDKSLDRLDEHCRRFLAASTFCTIASCSADGRMDVSPKGDPPGFARVLDDVTIAIPERPGNRRCDTFVNVLENPSVGVIFLVPGIDETLRVNGSGSLTTEPVLLASMAVEGRAPKIALVVHVEEAFVHCGKALRRGSVWGDTPAKDRQGFATMGAMLHAHAHADELGLSLETVVALADDDYHNNRY